MKTISIASETDLPSAAAEFIDAMGPNRVFAFYGEMGAGKTTFIKALCSQLGVNDKTASPTFSIVNEYRTASGQKIYHFDLYRLKTEEELYDIGYEEYLFSGNLCLIEWPEKMGKLLPEGAVKIQVRVQNGARTLSLI